MVDQSSAGEIYGKDVKDQGIMVKQIVKEDNEMSNVTKVSEFLRYDGSAKIVKDDFLIAKVREIMPQIMDLYDKNGWEMGLFYLENGHAEIRGMMDLKEEFDV